MDFLQAKSYDLCNRKNKMIENGLLANNGNAANAKVFPFDNCFFQMKYWSKGPLKIKLGRA